MRPSGSGRAPKTPSVCPSRVASGAPLWPSHRRRVPSPDHERMLPSGIGRAPHTHSVCPSRVASGAPLCPSHRRRAPSADHDRMRPSGSGRAPLTWAVCPSKTCKQGSGTARPTRCGLRSHVQSHFPAVSQASAAAVTGLSSACSTASCNKLLWAGQRSSPRLRMCSRSRKNASQSRVAWSGIGLRHSVARQSSPSPSTPSGSGSVRSRVIR